jgi:hypothetical protein
MEPLIVRPYGFAARMRRPVSVSVYFEKDRRVM